MKIKLKILEDFLKANGIAYEETPDSEITAELDKSAIETEKTSD
jgi:hypothetical protein